MSEFRRGTRIGIDVGKARVGVAKCDPDGMLATPVETVPRDERAIARVREIADDYSTLEYVIGLPMNLRGEDTPSTADARAFAEELALGATIPVRMVDERLSTVTAHSALRASGRNQKNSRSIVDQVAAVVILQHAIDTEKRSGTAPGFLISPESEPRS
ncbi:Holliday junction resolvase RuvX [Microbacterium sp. NC79]|uniref:Holliday junction resolvase RuvX n=1 Tax=Microbacterium sp. NC79 TaxID=2851009 RepID=UPI001C2B9816|nr:Holliday junction resolvase RuvX [Microbacterium sp. NC79]